MAQAYKISPHVFYQLHFTPYHIVCKRSGHTSAVFVPVCALQQQALTIQQERPMICKCKRTEAETPVPHRFTGSAFDTRLHSIQLRQSRRPKRRLFNSKMMERLLIICCVDLLRPLMDNLTRRVLYADLQARLLHVLRIPENSAQ